MGRGMESLESAYSVLFTLMLIALAVLVMLCLVRAIIGPRVADRIVSVNMTGTMVIVMIAILALMLEEGYLVDICLIYAMISFLAVIVLVKVYMGVYLMGKQAEDTGRAEKDREDSREALQKGAEEWNAVPGNEENGKCSDVKRTEENLTDSRGQGGAGRRGSENQSSVPIESGNAEQSVKAIEGGEKEDKRVVKTDNAAEEDVE